MRNLLTIATFFIAITLSAQDNISKLLSDANAQYTNKAYVAAERSFIDILKHSPYSYIAQFNLGNTYYRSNQAEKAITQFEALCSSSASKDIKAKAFYNLGVLLRQQKKLDESIIAYKNSLRLNPLDEEARENLQRALREKQQSQRQSSPPKPKSREKMSQKQIKQLLNALQEQENQLRQRMNKSKPDAPNKPEKDW